MNELEDDLVDEKIVNGGAEDEDDLILAGAPDADPNESAYKKLVMGESGYSPANAGAQGQS